MDKSKIRSMTRELYDAQTAAAKRELKRLKAESKTTQHELNKAVLDHKIALGYQTTDSAQLCRTFWVYNQQQGNGALALFACHRTYVEQKARE